MVAAHIRGIMYEHKAPLASWTKMLVMIMIMEIGDMSSDKNSTTNRARERCSLLDESLDGTPCTRHMEKNHLDGVVDDINFVDVDDHDNV